jgi:hypothetical protein
MKTKTFEIHFRHRQNGQLDDVFERGEATSKAKAVAWGKAIALERGWWFMSARELSAEEIAKQTA